MPSQLAGTGALLLERLRGEQMQPRGPARGQGGVERATQQLMREREPVDLLASLEQAGAERGLDRRQRRPQLGRHDRLQLSEAELVAEHRGGRQGLGDAGWQRLKPAAEELLDRLRHRDRFQRGDDRPVVAGSDGGGHELRQDVLDQERIAPCRGVQRAYDRGPRVGVLRRRERRDLVLAQTAEPYAGHAPLPAQVGDQPRERLWTRQRRLELDVAVAVGGEHDQLGASRPGDQLADQPQRGRIGPVQVVEHEHEAILGRHL